MEHHNTGEILNGMTDLSDEIYFIFETRERRFQYVNAAFEAITKRERREVFEKPGLLFEIIHKEDLTYAKNAFKALLSKKTNTLLNFRICRPDNTERWIRLKVFPIVKDDRIAYITGVGEDDTSRKASIFNMQKVNGWKNANLEILSHDLRGPIGVVKMLTTVIGKKLPDNPELQKLTNTILEISQRNIDLIQTLLKNEFLATAAVDISKERLDVVWEINQAMDIYLKAQKNIKKQIQFTHSHENIFAEVDSMKFLQIINNLVSNAIKFTDDGGFIKVHLEKLETTFLITVEDNGIGIPKSLQPILFEKYTKAGRKGIEGEESVGLGMWIVRTLTEDHDGKVWFESDAKKGSKFYVEIPLAL
jgi:two-component system sensor histidine kinase VicK